MYLYAVKHHGCHGEGSGTTIAVASSERMVRILVATYLQEKDDGYRQFHSKDLLEVELHEDSTFSHEAVTDRTPGIKLEYWFRDENDYPHPQLVFLGYGAQKLADTLEGLPEGRKLACIQHMCRHLRQDRLTEAKACAYLGRRDICSYLDIVKILGQVGFWNT